MVFLLKKVIIILFLTNLAYFSFSQTNSVLSTGSWYKVEVSESGIHKLDYDFFSQLGVNLDSLDPKKIKIYGNGGGMLPQANNIFRYKDLIENPIYVQGESDGIFNQGDYVLFYAKGPDTWSFDPIQKDYFHTKNIYSDYSYYFIEVDNGNGKRILDRPSLNSTTSVINSFDDHVFYEKDLVNVLNSGRQWYGEAFRLTPARDISFNIPGLIPNSDIKITSSVMGRSSQPSNFSIKLNGITLGTHNFTLLDNSQYSYKGHHDTKTFNINGATIGNSSLLTVNLTYNKTNSNSDGYLNYLEVITQRELKLYGSQTAFRSSSSLQTNESTFIISQTPLDAKIWDVTYLDSISNQLYIKNGNQCSFSINTSTLREFVVFTGTSFPLPKIVGSIPNQNLHSIGVANLPDLVIVVADGFLSQAEKLAEFRRTNDKLDVAVVTTTQVYNEFSSGAQDITAIRDFMKMLYNRKSGLDSVRYLLLFGDGSFDYKNRVAPNTNFVPIYESRESLHPINSHSSDDYFGFLDDNEGEWAEGSGNDHILDIGIGRLVVKNSIEAEDVLKKIINYSQNPDCLGKWRNMLTFLADDGDNNLHLSGSETLSNFIESTYKEYNTLKLYIDAFPQVSAPGGESSIVKTRINETVDQGTLVMNYTGHGGVFQLSQENIIDMDQINNRWKNFNRPFFFVTATCEFGKYDDPKIVSGGEDCLLTPIGGAIGLLTSTRPVYSNTNLQLNQAFYECLFKEISGELPRLGDVIRITKNTSLAGINNRNYALLGDPSLRLAYPEKEAVITSINDSIVSTSPDTIKALSKVTIKGDIQNNGTLISDFNGSVNITVYDRATTIKTLGTQGSSPTTFYARDNFIFEGNATVENGKFTISFVAPKDISYNLSSGKISLYAKKDNSNDDANGEYSNFVIGGTGKNYAVDNTPPVIDLYMNDETFRTGGLTNSNSNLYAILSDDNGINLSSSGIGHEITASLDGGDDILLNSYYSSNKDNYRQGKVIFPFYDLSPGRHTLRLKAWDTYNNSSVAYIEFIVANDGGLALQNVSNYPNPFSANTTFQFEHNRAGDDLQVQLDIYSTTGQLIRTIERTYYSSSARVADLEWGISNESINISPGIYMYLLKVKSLNDTTEALKHQRMIAY